MKNNYGLYPIVLDITDVEKSQHNFVRFLQGCLRIFVLSLISLLMLSASGFAQASKADLAAVYKSNTNDSKMMKREIKAEKESTRAVENISSQTMEKFNSSFPAAKDVEWSVPGEQFVEVQFHNKKNKPMMAFYGFDGRLLGMGHYTDYSAIPSKAQKFIEKKYQGYAPVKVMWIDLNEDSDEALDLFETPIPSDGYFVQMKNNNKQIVLQVETDGDVSFFSEMQK